MRGRLKYIIIIPARYPSTRFPGKPLAKIGGEEMILYVCRAAAATGERVVVATDDERILRCVESRGYEAVMTSNDCKSGTDRVWEAYCKLHSDVDVVINLQGDEPFVKVEHIRSLMECFDSDPSTQIATLVKPFDKNEGFESLFDSNRVKVTYARDGRALCFSRSIVPYIRGEEWRKWLDSYTFHIHIGIYGFRASVLGEVTALPVSGLERAENLEQLRWLENGYPIMTRVVADSSIGIDTPSDLEKAEKMLK